MDYCAERPTASLKMPPYTMLAYNHFIKYCPVPRDGTKIDVLLSLIRKMVLTYIKIITTIIYLLSSWSVSSMIADLSGNVAVINKRQGKVEYYDKIIILCISLHPIPKYPSLRHHHSRQQVYGHIHSHAHAAAHHGCRACPHAEGHAKRHAYFHTNPETIYLASLLHQFCFRTFVLSECDKGLSNRNSSPPFLDFGRCFSNSSTSA